MKKGTLIWTGIGGLVVGMLVAFMIVWFVMPSMMMKVDESPYSFDVACEKLEASIEDAGWKIPTVHDLQKTMEKYGQDVRPVKVFEICHPDHAGRILEASEERLVSALMPCRIAVYENAEGKTFVSRMNSGLMGKMFGGLIADVMADASRESEEISKVILE